MIDVTRYSAMQGMEVAQSGVEPIDGSADFTSGQLHAIAQVHRRHLQRQHTAATLLDPEPVFIQNFAIGFRQVRSMFPRKDYYTT